MDGDFIVRAKAGTYVGAGQPAVSSRLGSHDLCFDQGPWHYRDSYFGGTDFIGQEVVWYCENPVWAMNDFGRNLRDDLIDAGRAAKVIPATLTALNAQGRFPGGFQMQLDRFHYSDETHGTDKSFSGTERIVTDGTLAYQLDDHGGLIRA